MSKRTILASLVAGLALAAQTAAASDLWFYPGHGWLPQPPFSTPAATDYVTTVVAGPTSAAAGTQPSATRIPAPAPYDRSSFDAGYFN